MKKCEKNLLVSSVVATLVLSTVVLNSNNKVFASTRFQGKDRYKTSIDISKNGWKRSRTVIIASGADFADAICATPFAKIKSAPILLCQKNKIDDGVLNEIKRLQATDVIIVGGPGAVSDSIERKLTSLNGVKNVERIYGKDRYETSMKIAERIGSPKDVVFASGKNFADAVSIAPIAASRQMPILLADKDYTSMKSDFYVNLSNKINNVYILGGRQVIGREIEKSFNTPIRIYGKNRYETNVKVLREFQNNIDFDKVYLATGQNYADALCGSCLASQTNSPIALVNSGVLPSETLSYIRNEIMPNTDVISLGGESVVNNSNTDTLKINCIDFNESKLYGSQDSKNRQDIKNNVFLSGNSSKLSNANVRGDVYLGKYSLGLKNVNVSGSVYVDSNRGIRLDNVKAKNIIIFNDESNEITLNECMASNLNVMAKNNSSPYVKLTGTCKFSNVNISSSCKFDSGITKIDKLNINGSSQLDKYIDLSGKYKNIDLNDNVIVKLDDKTSVETINGYNSGEDSEVIVPSGASVLNGDKAIYFKGEGAETINKMFTSDNKNEMNCSIDVVQSDGILKSNTVNMDVINIVGDRLTVKVVDKDNGRIVWLNQVDTIENGKANISFKLFKSGRYSIKLVSTNGIYFSQQKTRNIDIN